MSFLISLFDDKLADNRVPWISGVKIPSFEGVFTIFAPEPGPWLQLIAVSDDCDACVPVSDDDTVCKFMIFERWADPVLAS